MISGVGVDLVHVDRLRIALERTAGFAEMVFTPEERAAADHGRTRTRQLAAVFAAKEAFLKAIGLGLWRGVPLNEIEVVRSGRSRVGFRLGPLAEKAMGDRGGRAANLSVSHDRNTALAVVTID